MTVKFQDSVIAVSGCSVPMVHIISNCKSHVWLTRLANECAEPEKAFNWLACQSIIRQAGTNTRDKGLWCFRVQVLLFVVTRLGASKKEYAVLRLNWELDVRNTFPNNGNLDRFWVTSVTLWHLSVAAVPRTISIGGICSSKIPHFSLVGALDYLSYRS